MPHAHHPRTLPTSRPITLTPHQPHALSPSRPITLTPYHAHGWQDGVDKSAVVKIGKSGKLAPL